MIVRVILPFSPDPREYAFHRAEALIGSGRRTDLRIPLPNVAVRHARLRRTEDRVWLEPLQPGQVVMIERVQVGRIKVTGPIALRPGDRVMLGSDSERATIELISIERDEPSPQADTIFSLDAAEGSAPPPLLEAVTRFAVDVSGVERSGELRQALTRLAQHFAVDAEVPAGVVLFGSGRRPPRWWVASELAERLRGDGALMTGADWRRDVRARLARGEVLKAQSGRQPAVVVVPLRSAERTAGVWTFAARRPVALNTLEAVAGMVSQLVAGALERLDQSGELRSLREENRYFRGRERRHYLYKELVTESPAMRRVYAELNRLIDSAGPIWILGEKGSGKEMLARAVHHLGYRTKALMISQNCATMTEPQLDHELFGVTEAEASERAVTRPGLLELCDGGTLFLEEIEQLPPRLQTKLGRAIQEREVRPEGSAIGRPVDVRLIISSERDLALLVAAGRFRKDLYLQLVQQPLRLPPLRERVEDIVPLADVFVTTLSPRYHKRAVRVAPATHDRLRRYGWPGNVRELQGYIEAAIIRVDPEAEEIDAIPGLA